MMPKKNIDITLFKYPTGARGCETPASLHKKQCSVRFGSYDPAYIDHCQIEIIACPCMLQWMRAIYFFHLVAFA
jgi:hypothetical protein